MRAAQPWHHLGVKAQTIGRRIRELSLPLGFYSFAFFFPHSPHKIAGILESAGYCLYTFAFVLRAARAAEQHNLRGGRGKWVSAYERAAHVPPNVALTESSEILALMKPATQSRQCVSCPQAAS
jgi:hypothetical protein